MLSFTSRRTMALLIVLTLVIAIATTTPFAVVGRDARVHLERDGDHFQRVAVLSRKVIVELESEEVASLKFVTENGTAVPMYTRTKGVRDAWDDTDDAISAFSASSGGEATYASEQAPVNGLPPFFSSALRILAARLKPAKGLPASRGTI